MKNNTVRTSCNNPLKPSQNKAKSLQVPHTKPETPEPNPAAAPEIPPAASPENQEIRPAWSTKIFIPAEVAQETEAALAQLNTTGNATVSFLIMNAYQIRNSANAYAGWEHFDLPGFGEGVEELARRVGANFQAIAAGAENAAARAAKILKHFSQPVDTTGAYLSRAFEEIDPNDYCLKLEEACHALTFLLYLQILTCDCENKEDTFEGFWVVRKMFEAAITRADRALRQMKNVYETLATNGSLA